MRNLAVNKRVLDFGEIPAACLSVENAEKLAVTRESVVVPPEAGDTAFSCFGNVGCCEIGASGGVIVFVSRTELADNNRRAFAHEFLVKFVHKAGHILHICGICA